MENSDGANQWRESEVLDLINIWGDISIQAKLEGSYRNRSVFDQHSQFCFLSLRSSPPQHLLINFTASITQTFRIKSEHAYFLHNHTNISATACCV